MSKYTHKSSGNKIWGIFLVLAACLLIFDAVGGSLGIMGLDQIPLFRLLIAVTLVIWAFSKLIRGDFALTFFPLAFAFMILEDWIATLCKLEDPNIVNNWLLLLCAVLLTTGFGFLTSDWKIFRIRKNNGASYTLSGGSHRSNNEQSFTFGDYTKYIDGATFTSVTVTSKFAETNVYFENVDAYVGGGSLCVENAFGAIVVHVPHTWNIVTDFSSNAFGDISIPARNVIAGAPTLTICGRNAFGEIEIVTNG